MIIKSLYDMQLIAQNYANKSKKGDVFLLIGNLGVGKTTFAKYFIQHCTKSKCDVLSPTFNYLKIYGHMDNILIYHFDLYRIDENNSIQKSYEIGIEDAFENGIVIIEWPEKIKPLLSLYNFTALEIKMYGTNEYRTIFEVDF